MTRHHSLPPTGDRRSVLPSPAAALRRPRSLAALRRPRSLAALRRPRSLAALRRPRNQSGAALVEFALVIGLFAFVLYGLIAFGMILATKQRITHASAEAARSAVGSANPAAAETAATNRLLKILGEPGKYTATYDTDACPAVPAGPRCIKVTVTWDYENHPVVPPAPGLGVFTPDSFGSDAVVQYQ